MKRFINVIKLLPAVIIAVMIIASLKEYTPTIYGDIRDSVTEEVTEKATEKKERKREELPEKETDNEPVTIEREESAAAYKDGIYYGTGKGFAGNITVKVTITSGKIESIVITDTVDGAEYISKVSAIISQIIATQSTNVDTVSGATFSSVGIISAVRDALKKAAVNPENIDENIIQNEETTANAEVIKKPDIQKDDFKYKDGIYYGTGNGFAGSLTVKVVIRDGLIKEIIIKDTSDGAEFISKASALIEEIIATQSTNVDTVTGATYSSVGIIEAVRDALKKAAVDDSVLEETTKEYDTETTAETTKSVETTKETITDIRLKYKDGVYYGTGKGFDGNIRVKVTIKKGKLKSIEVVKHTDGPEFMEKAKALLKEIIRTQSSEVDVISGATYSSNGLIEAVKDALKQALIYEEDTETTREKVTTTKNETTKPAETTSHNTHEYKTGIYYGTAEGFRGDITVAVVIEDNAIQYVLVTDYDDDEAFIAKAKAVIKDVIISQSTSVDVVSGATYSSGGILNAIEDALQKAVENPETSGKDESTDKNETTKPETTKVQNDTTNETGITDETTTKNSTSESEYKDGIYSAEYECVPDFEYDFEPYRISLSVVVENGVISSITDIKGIGNDYDSYNDWYLERAANGNQKFEGVVSQIIKNNGTKGVDTVSGATCSSKGIIGGVDEALKNAKGMK